MLVKSATHCIFCTKELRGLPATAEFLDKQLFCGY